MADTFALQIEEAYIGADQFCSLVRQDSQSVLRNELTVLHGLRFDLITHPPLRALQGFFQAGPACLIFLALNALFPTCCTTTSCDQHVDHSIHVPSLAQLAFMCFSCCTTTSCDQHVDHSTRVPSLAQLAFTCFSRSMPDTWTGNTVLSYQEKGPYINLSLPLRYHCSQNAVIGSQLP